MCVREVVGKIGEAGEERTCACGQCHIRHGMRHDTVDDNCFSKTQRCAILEHEPRVFA